MSDQLLTGQLAGCDIAVAYALTTETVSEAVRRHRCDPAAAHLLGRAITSGVLAAASLGEHQRLNLRWAYEGALRTIVVDTGPDGATRAFITPHYLADSSDEGAIYGAAGSIQVIRTRKGAVVSHGNTRADLLDVVEDLGHFLCISDQIESAIAVTISLSNDPANPVRICRGLLLQAMPGCALNRFQRIRDRLHSSKVRDWLTRAHESDSLVENLLHALVDGEAPAPRIRLTSGIAPFFKCTCGPGKMGAVLRALPYGDRMDIVKKNEPLAVSCRFCGARYELSIADCIRAWNEKSSPAP